MGLLETVNLVLEHLKQHLDWMEVVSCFVLAQVLVLVFTTYKKEGSMQVSGKLPTYPSAKPNLTPRYFSLKAKCRLRGGLGG